MAPRQSPTAHRNGYIGATASEGFYAVYFPLLSFKNIHSYISAEENALYFETHIQLYPAVADPADPNTPAVDTETGLDFEELP